MSTLARLIKKARCFVKGHALSETGRHDAEFQFCNEAETFVAFANVFSVGEDGWAQLAPFGDFPGMALEKEPSGNWKKYPAIQRVDKESITQLVNDYQSARRGPKKFLRAAPIFLGHPDAPGATGAKYPDKGAKGVFANQQVREDGLYGEPVFTNEGEELLSKRSGLGFSVRWSAKACGEENHNGTATKIFKPDRLFSAGLTDRPNLPVQLLNEQDDTNINTMKKTVIALLLAGGIKTPAGAEFTNDAPDTDVEAGLKALETKAKKADALEADVLAARATTVQITNEKAALEGKVTTLIAEKGTLTTDLGTARTQFANERKARIADALGTAVAAGKITDAEKPTWETRLAVEANFTNELEALSKLTAKVKTESITLTRGDRKVEITNAAERREVVAELVNERMQSTKCDYNTAFGFVQKSYPQLFAAMEQPEVKKGGVRK